MTNIKHIIFFCVALLSASIHISVSLQFSDYPIIFIPILFLLFVFFFAPFWFAIFYSLVHALILDLYSPLPFGSHAVLFCVLLIAMFILSKTFFSQQSIASNGLLSAGITAVYILAIRGIEHIQLSVFESTPQTFFPLGFTTHYLLIIVVQTSILMILTSFQQRQRPFSLKPHLID